MSFKEHYRTKVIPELMKEFGYKNPHAVPAVKMITLNIGLGKGLKDAKYLETTESTLRRITGAQPVKTLSRKSISNFKIREGMAVGMKVTLRGTRMWDFLEKLVKISIPRMQDFRGLSPKSFDGQGNYSLGFTEHMAFPEIRTDEIEVVHGMQLTIVTSAKSTPEARALLKGLGFPFTDETK